MLKRRILTAAVVSSIAVLAAALPIQAQGVGQEIGFTVRFDFTAGGQALKAGDYIVKSNGGQPNGLRLERVDGKMHVMLSPTTRLARQHQGDAPKASLVFDEVDGKRALSEIWLPNEDGYLVGSIKEKHQHMIVDVK